MKRKAKPRESKEVRQARERWAMLNMFHLRLFEARGGVTACINHAKRNGLDAPVLEGILEQLKAEAGRVAQARDRCNSLTGKKP